MKHKFLALMTGLVVIALLITSPRADTGWDQAVRKEIGTYGETFRVYGTSVAGTAFFSASKNRPDGAYFNNSATTVWIGTVTATRNGQLHDNIQIGFPVLSSATFTLDGSFAGTLAFTCNEEVVKCEIRGLEGRVPAAN